MTQRSLPGVPVAASSVGYVGGWIGAGRARMFARALGRAGGRRAWLPVPAPLVRMDLDAALLDLLVGPRGDLPRPGSDAAVR